MVLGGCGKPPGEPREIVQQLFDAYDFEDYEKAYALFSSNFKSHVSKEEFILVQNKLKKNSIIISTERKIAEIKDIGKKNITGIDFKNVHEVTVYNKIVLKTLEENYSNYKIYVVNEKGNWKIYIPSLHENWQKLLTETNIRRIE